MKLNKAGRRSAFAVPVALVLVCAGLVLVAGCSDTAGSSGDGRNESAIQSDMAVALAMYQDGVQERLASMQADSLSCAAVIAAAGPEDLEMSAFLSDCHAQKPWYYTVVYIDAGGVVQDAVPESAEVIIGANLSHQESIFRMNTDPSFRMVPVFPLEQGGSAAAVYAPVHSADGEYLGFVSITFAPDALIRPVAEEVSATSGFDTMAAQTDSLVLYDPDAFEIGEMTFDNPLYDDFPDLIAFAHAYNQSPSGIARYRFYSTGFGEFIAKEAMWDTVTCGETPWRLMIIRPV